MKTLFVLVFLFVAVCEIYADDTLECYQCTPVTEECSLDKASSIRCGSTKNSRCIKRLKKDATDESKAIRKCGVPDATGKVACPDGFNCFECDSDLCNSASIMKITWAGLISTVLAVLYMH